MPFSDIGEDESKGPRSPFERTYRGLVRGLYEGRFVPGQRLIAPDLMRQFDVGRGTIREVLNRLASSGIISLIPHRGAEVRRLTRREVGELLDIVELLLGLAARGTASAMTDPASRDMLLSRYEELCSHGSFADFSGFLRAREEYYRSLVQLSGNRELQRIFPAVQVHIMRLQLRSFNRAGDSAHLEDYGELTQAIVSADPDRAEKAARRHVQLTMERVAQVPENAFAPII